MQFIPDDAFYFFPISLCRREQLSVFDYVEQNAPFPMHRCGPSCETGPHTSTFREKDDKELHGRGLFHSAEITRAKSQGHQFLTRAQKKALEN